MKLMKYKRQKLRPLLQAFWFCVFFIPTANAQWVEASGSAAIYNDDISSAKYRAMKQALRQAMLFSGASVHSIQQLTDGLLTQDQVKLTSHNEVKQLVVVNEAVSRQTVNITIRADIFPMNERCESSNFKKTIAITQFNLTNREQAQIGNIYGIGKDFSRHLFQSLKLHSKSISARPWFDKRIAIAPAADEYFSLDNQVINQIAEQSNSEYVLLGQVIDTSFDEPETHTVQFWKDDEYTRYFAIDFMLVHAATGEIIFRDNIGTTGDWPFGIRKSIDTKSMRFWQSGYGTEIKDVVATTHQLLEESVQCSELSGRVTRIMNDSLQFNLGKRQGIRKGQMLKISYLSNFVDAQGNIHPNRVISPFVVTVQQVFENSSIATSSQLEFPGNVQEQDIITLYEYADPWFE